MDKTRKEIAEEICNMNLPIDWGDWENIEREIEEAHDIPLPQEDQNAETT